MIILTPYTDWTSKIILTFMNWFNCVIGINTEISNDFRKATHNTNIIVSRYSFR